MSEEQTPLEALLAEQANQPFGDIEIQSNKTLAPFSAAGRKAAENLLSKAQRALGNDEPERAKSYINKAVQLPYDEHEETDPAAWVAHLDLFGVVVDAAEECPPDDSRWLDAALHLLEETEDPARSDLRVVLSNIDQDYQLTGTERTRLRAAIDAVPKRASLDDLRLSPQELAEHVLANLMLIRRYQQVYEDAR